MIILNIMTHGKKLKLKKNLRLVGDNFILTKGNYYITIFYKNGDTEKTSIRDAGGVFIIKIKTDEYYMDDTRLTQ